MGTNIQVRHAQRQDRPEWIRMRRALWPYCSDDEQESETLSHFENPSENAVLVAEISTGDSPPQICGFAELSIRHDYVESTSNSPVAYLEGWYVDPDYRGQGVGRQLVATAEQWALAQGISELASDTEVTNHQSISAHQACGFSDAVTIVHFVKRLRST